VRTHHNQWQRQIGIGEAANGLINPQFNCYSRQSKPIIDLLVFDKSQLDEPNERRLFELGINASSFIIKRYTYTFAGSET